MHDGLGHFCYGNTSRVPIVWIFVCFNFHTEWASWCPTTALIVFMHTTVWEHYEMPHYCGMLWVKAQHGLWVSSLDVGVEWLPSDMFSNDDVFTCYWCDLWPSGRLARVILPFPDLPRDSVGQGTQKKGGRNFSKVSQVLVAVSDRLWFYFGFLSCE